MEESEDGWTENRGLPRFSSDLSRMVLIESVSEGEAGRFPHIVSGMVSVKDEIPVSTLTQGPREVTKILAWDQDSDSM